ncbi:MAG: flagellar export chaperone FlgN [Burkholderiales bacterium]|nr:flagellar protein FlgN [Nitrosomonadaceae bacterium]
MPTALAASPTPLRRLLDSEFLAISEYLELAEQETDAIARSDADAMLDISQRKSQALERLATARTHTKRALGEPISAETLRAKLSAAGPGASELFESIIAKVREAMELDHITARLIAHQSKRIEQRAGIVNSLGGNGSGVPNYGADGFARFGGNFGSFGRA